MATMPAPPENLADRPTPPAGLLRPPRELADHPALEDAALRPDANRQPRDLLSELLRSVRLSGERVVAYGPLRTFSSGFAGIGALHIVDEGEVVLRIDGVPHIERASDGDVILLPRGDLLRCPAHDPRRRWPHRQRLVPVAPSGVSLASRPTRQAGRPERLRPVPGRRPRNQRAASGEDGFPSLAARSRLRVSARPGVRGGPARECVSVVAGELLDIRWRCAGDLCDSWGYLCSFAAPECA
jgi:hypothetical protein